MMVFMFNSFKKTNVKNRVLCLLIFFFLFPAFTFTEEQDRAKNAVALSFGIFGAEASYERMFSRHLSVLADVSYTTMIFMDEFTVSGKGRWYPFGKTFYLDLGLGYTYGKGVVGFMGDMILGVMTFGYYWLVKDWEDDIFRTGGFLIQPGIGWKIDIGKPDKFVLPIGLGVDIKVAEVPDFMPYFRIGLGYAF